MIKREDGFRAEEIIWAQARMFEYQAIPSLVPLRLEETDAKIVLRYRLDGLRPLASALPVTQPSERFWEGLLVAIAMSIQDAGRYLIREHELVLDPEWIWTAEDARQVRLMALPLKTCITPETAWKQWEALYLALCRSGLPSDWQERLRPQRWEAATFSHRLWIQALHEEPLESAMERQTMEFAEEGKAATMLSVVDDGRVPSAPDRTEDLEATRSSIGTLSKDDWVRLLLAFICWIGFAIFPVWMTLLLACFGSIPLCIMLWQRRRLEETKPERPIPVEPQEEGMIQGPLAERTMLLRSPDATKALSEAEALALFQPHKAWLEVTFEGENRVETVELGKEPFVIGRDPENVHLVIDHPAVSRRHAEISWVEGMYQTKDLGSLNGTVVNDSVIKPNEHYPLESGSILRVPGIRIVFRMGPKQGAAFVGVSLAE